MGLQVSKNIILPHLDRIQDLEIKRVLQELSRLLQQTNTTYHNDFVHLEERIKALEP